MKGNELVWRALTDAALRGQRRWASVGDLAFAAGVPATTANFALQKLVAIGAVEQHPRGGLSAVNPEKIITVLAARRDLQKDTLAVTTRDGIREMLARSPDRPYALGGPDAAIAHLDGWNNIADIGMRLVYLPVNQSFDDLPEGDQVRVLGMDKRAQREWLDGFSSISQTYSDLFASPGWQAEEFRRALWARHFGSPDWDQRVAPDA